MTQTTPIFESSILENRVLPLVKNVDEALEDIDIDSIPNTEAIGHLSCGPVNADLYLEGSKVRLKTSFVDEEKQYAYLGQDCLIATVPEKLLKMQKASPARYLYSTEWYRYIRSLWRIVLDSDYFYNSGW